MVLFSVGLKLLELNQGSCRWHVYFCCEYSFCLVWRSCVCVCVLAERTNSGQGDKTWQSCIGHKRPSKT